MLKAAGQYSSPPPHARRSCSIPGRRDPTTRVGTLQARAPGSTSATGCHSGNPTGSIRRDGITLAVSDPPKEWDPVDALDQSTLDPVVSDAQLPLACSEDHPPRSDATRQVERRENIPKETSPSILLPEGLRPARPGISPSPGHGFAMPPRRVLPRRGRRSLGRK